MATPKRRPGEGLRDYEKRIGAKAGSITRQQPGAAGGGALTAKQQKQVDASIAAGQQGAGASNLTQNANVQGPFGSSTVTVDPVTGQPTQTNTLSDTEEAKYQGGSNLNITGTAKAQGFMDDLGQFQPGDPTEVRQQAFDTAYDYMSRNLARDKNREMESLEQRLYNRGIPLDPDDPQYEKWMGDLNERYDTQARDYASQAYLSSGTEADRIYGQSLGTHQQNVSDIGTLSQVGTGFTPPTAPAVQGTSITSQDPNTLDLATKQLMAENKLKRAQAGYYGRPRGGSSSSETEDYGFSA